RGPGTFLATSRPRIGLEPKGPPRPDRLSPRDRHMPPPTQNQPPQVPPPAPRRASPLLPGGWIALLVLLAVTLVIVFFIDQPREIPYTAFRELVDAGQVKKVAIVGNERAAGEVRGADAGGDPELVTSILKKVEINSLPNGKFTLMLPYTNDRSGF